MNDKRDPIPLMDLGAVTAQTKGLPWGMDDFQAGLYVRAGLAQD